MDSLKIVGEFRGDVSDVNKRLIEPVRPSGSRVTDMLRVESDRACMLCMARRCFGHVKS